MTLIIETQNASFYDHYDGSVDLTVHGGKTPYIYYWSNGATTQDINGICQGSYMVTVTDADGMEESETAIVDFNNTIFDSGTEGRLMDIDGNIYAIVKIGDQWWMAENLKVENDADNNPIVFNDYEGDSLLVAEYGYLYTWTTIMKGTEIDGTKGIAPDGWHIPSQAEWEILIAEIGGSTHGGKLKETGFVHWVSPNTGATNETGFTALPGGGILHGEEDISMIGNAGIFFSSSVASGLGEYIFRLSAHDSEIVSSALTYSDDSFSLRCIMD